MFDEALKMEGSRRKDFRRVDTLYTGSSADQQAAHLLDHLKAGLITVDDLMGPLYGIKNLSPAISIPPGAKAAPSSADDSPFLPLDDANLELLRNVHPAAPDFANPEPLAEYDLVAIGGGVGGLISVIMGKWLGKKCALIERHSMGGDCLNIGCVPSKAVIACARAFHAAKHEMGQFGVNIQGPISIDFGFVMKRMREIRARISHHDSVQRYSKEFCEHVFVGSACFAGGNTIRVTGDDGSIRNVKFKKAMIATGAAAAIPPIPGLKETPHLTNSNFFNLQDLPPTMAVIGTGPIGIELAQAMTRFGCEVHCLEVGPQLLPREDPDAAAVLQRQLAADGLNIELSVKIVSIEYEHPAGATASSMDENVARYAAPWGTYIITYEDSDGQTRTLRCAALLNATGRVPNVHGLGLDEVNVEWDNRRGVHVDEYYCTANPDIYACGDCASPYKFTHAADFQARAAVRNMFLGGFAAPVEGAEAAAGTGTEAGASRGWVKASDMLVPWCTYTEPEIAHVGKYERELAAAGVEYESFKRELAPVDRCLCDGVTEGFVKITVKAGTSQILGATICGPNAGDMISELTLAMQYGITVPEIAGTIHPYPTTQEAIRQACLGYNKYYKNPDGAPLKALKMLMAELESGSCDPNSSNTFNKDTPPAEA